MNLEEELRRLKKAAKASVKEQDLERQLQYLRRLEDSPKKLPAQRAPRGIEEYVDGRVETNDFGDFFLAQQTLPFGRPYGGYRIGDFTTADISSLSVLFNEIPIPEPSQLVYLDTETTGLAGGTGTCAFLIGIAAAQSSQFVVRQFFLRDYPEEKATLAALAEVLEGYRGVVTFNGKTFDIPLLETRYALARLKSPFNRMIHLDLLHPARRLWKLRLLSCELTHLEREVLGIGREGDVAGSEIPGIYFDYLRTGNAQRLQPVFYHNALDVVTLAALAAEMAGTVNAAGGERAIDSLDLFSLSKVFDRARATEKSVAACKQALTAGLPESIETRALWQLASQHKRSRQHQHAVELWKSLVGREDAYAAKALEELAIHYEHRERNVGTAMEFTMAAIARLREVPAFASPLKRLNHRLERLRQKSVRTATQGALAGPPGGK
jgi:uncharacterized protein YprB with RNaseH-like and TPR domain